jgi:hypothetical protein
VNLYQLYLLQAEFYAAVWLLCAPSYVLELSCSPLTNSS